jgi:hypothetical protein
MKDKIAVVLYRILNNRKRVNVESVEDVMAQLNVRLADHIQLFNRRLEEQLSGLKEFNFNNTKTEDDPN